MILAIWWIVTALLAVVGAFAICPKWLMMLVSPKYYCAGCKEELEVSNRYRLEMDLQKEKPFSFRQV